MPEEQKNPKLVEQVFKKLAQIHAMDVPVKRYNNDFIRDANNAYKNIIESKILNELIEDFGFEIFKTNDIKVEMDFMKELVLSAESPIVFTHLDYRSSNLMITKGHNNEEEIVICDFDFASYNYRARDFVALSNEWNRTQFGWLTSIEGFPPEDAVLKPLIEIYLKECEQI